MLVLAISACGIVSASAIRLISLVTSRFYRAAGTSLDTKIHPCLWWRSVKSDDVSGVTLTRTPLTPLSWGESAGSISVSLQMVTNGGDTEGLFRAAFMESGSPLATSDITAVGMYTAKILNF